MRSVPITSNPVGTSLHFTLPTQPIARVLHQIRVTAGPTRPALRDSLGYSQPSITRHVAALTSARLVEEVPAAGGDNVPGRPRTALALDGRHLVFLGAHIGVRSTVLVATDGGGRLLRHRTIPLNVQEISAEQALGSVAKQLRALGEGFPQPTDIGVAFSTHVDERGVISSDIYRWHDVNVADYLSAQLSHPVKVATGVTAMSATELLSHPLTPEPADNSSTLYFYAREVVAHAWMFRGGVHRPHSGNTPGYIYDIAADAGFPGIDLEPHVHPLSNTAVVLAARAGGIEADSFPALAHTPQARPLLDARADLLGEVINLAIDIVDPDSLVFAGEAFTSDPESLRRVVSSVRSRNGGSATLRIQRADPDVLRTTARHVALHHFWQNPLEQ